MPTPYDVPAQSLIKNLAEYMKDNVDEVTPPAWTPFVKTGVHADRTPEKKDWWFIRCASLLRKIYIKGPVGIERLRKQYGGRKDRGTKPEHASKGSGTILRQALHQLEAAGLVETLKGRGRNLTVEGRQLLDKLSTELKKNLEKQIPNLKRY